MTVWHKSMDAERWSQFPIEKQILMIGSEFARAKNLLRDNVIDEVRQCYERAFELLDLCTMDPKWRSRLRELLRFREALGELYLDITPDDPRFMPMFRILMSWHGNTARVKI